MRIAKVIFTVAVFLVLVGAGGLAYLAAYLDRHKGLVETAASTALGWEVRIDGGVKVDWSMRPTLALPGVSIANPAWAEGKFLAHAGQAVVQFDLPALLHGNLKLNRLALSDADVDLEAGADGRGNWDVEPQPDRRTGSGVAVAVDRLQIDATRLSYRGPGGASEDVSVHELVLRKKSGERWELTAQLLYRDLPMALVGESGTAPADGARGWPFSARASLKDMEIKVSGHALAFGNLTDAIVELQSSELDLRSISQILLPDPAVAGSLQQVRGRWRMSGDGPQTWLRNLQGKLEIGSAHLALPKDTGKPSTELAMAGAELTIAPEQATRFSSELTYDGHAIQVQLTGGTVEELLRNKQARKPIQLSANGRFVGQPLEVNGTVGPLSALLAASPIDVDLVALHHETRVRIGGTLAGMRTLDGARLTVEATGPDLSRLAPWFGMDFPQSPPYRLAAQTAFDDHRLRVRDLRAEFGDSDLAGELSLSFAKAIVVEGSLQSQVLDLAPFTTPKDIAATKATTWFERELPPHVLKGVDGTVQWQVARVRTSDQFEFEGVKLAAVLRDGHLTVKATAGEERLGADINLKPLEADWHFTLHHKGELDFSWLSKAGASGNKDLRPPLALDLSLNARGRSVSEILGSASGSLELVIGAGQLDERVARYLPLGSVLRTLVNAVSDSSEGARPHSQLECAVLKLDIADGVATSPRGLALRTGTVNVLGGGAIKLQSGEIDLHFKTAQRKGLGINILSIADRFIRLTGTVQNPMASVNVGGFLVHGGAAWATGGVSLVYDLFARRLTASSNPCETVLDTAVP